MKELWTRIVLNICIKNTDDHLRNHGFLLSDNGWELSPVFDINPNPFGTGLILNINEHDNSLDLDLPMSTIEFFRIKKNEASKIIAGIQKAVSNWRVYANEMRLPKSEQDLMESAFN